MMIIILNTIFIFFIENNGFRWEDGNNLTSNLFTLINNTGLLQHPKKIHQTYMHAHNPYTEKKTRRKINNNNNIF